MIKLSDAPLSRNTQYELRKLQDEVNRSGEYEKQVVLARKKWDGKSAGPFGEVRQKLKMMCQGVNRCHYCEDSAANQIEHFNPKDLYPDKTFVWSNMLWVCGLCNRAKWNKFWVFPKNKHTPLNATRCKGDPVSPPPEGDPVYIDPRLDDPFDFLRLDLKTGRFIPKTNNAKDHHRAEATIRDIDLNRDYLVERRKQMYANYKSRLESYISAKDKGAAEIQLLRMKNALVRKMNNHFVWQEMKRRHQKISVLKALFEAAPEALAW